MQFRKLAAKCTAMMLAASILIPAAGCNKKSAGGKTGPQNGTNSNAQKDVTETEVLSGEIASDMEWYDCDLLGISTGLENDSEYLNKHICGSDENYTILAVDGCKKLPDGVELTAKNYIENIISEVLIVSHEEGRIKARINTAELTNQLPNPQGFEMGDGKFSFILVTRDDNTGKIRSARRYTYNLSDGTKVSEEPVDDLSSIGQSGPATSGTEEYAIDLSLSAPSVMKIPVGDYKIGLATDNDPNNFKSVNRRIIVEDKSGNSKEISIPDEPDKESIPYLDSVVSCGNGKFLMLIYDSMDNSYEFYTVDTAGEIAGKASPDEYEWIKAGRKPRLYTFEDKAYIKNNKGIFQLDFDNKTSTPVFLYNNCDQNARVLDSLDVSNISDDGVVLAGTVVVFGKGGMRDSEFMVAKIKKAATNPHAGHTILTLCSLKGNNDALSNALVKFNEESSKYYIKYVDTYYLEDYNNSSELYKNDHMPSEAEYVSFHSNVYDKLGNQIAQDITNGDAPDIILNASVLGRIDNSEYLVDLSDYAKELGDDKYFTNVFEAAKKDGALYQMPLSFLVEGIMTDRKNVTEGQKGLTYEQFGQFVKTKCNGTNPILYGRNFALDLLFNYSADKFIKGGKADFSGKEFEELAKCSKEIFPAKTSEEWGDPYTDYASVDGRLKINSEHFRGGFNDYIDACNGFNGCEGAILGLPSVDGRGPSAYITDSIAVSAQCDDKDGCWEFIKTMLSEQSQIEFYNFDGRYCPVNRKAFDDMTAVELEDADKRFKESNGKMGSRVSSGASSLSSIGGLGMPTILYDAPPLKRKFDQKDADIFKAAVENISTTNRTEAEISIILVEEMPAYFSGQKKLSEVVKIVNDRAQKVLSERA